MVNFYASHEFLEAVSLAYFPDRRCEIRDFRVEGEIFRLLDVPGMGPLHRQSFLDVHEPLDPQDEPRQPADLGYMIRVSHGLVTAGAFRERKLAERFLAAPTVRWAGIGDWDAYEALLRARGSMVREDARRRRRLADHLGEPRFSVDDLREDVLPFAFAHKSAQMLRTLGWDLFADPSNRRFFEVLRERGLLRATTLRAGDRLLAAWLGVIHDRRWYGWVFAHDPAPELRRYSVGRQLLYAMLRESLESGQRELDFSIGDEDYKWYFATHARAVAPLGTPPLGDRMRRALALALRDTWLEEPARALRSALRVA